MKLPSFPFLISRIRHHGVSGSLYAARDALAWWATHAVLRRAPWSRNRLGQRFQMLCFSDYRHMRNGNPEVRESLFTERVLRPGMTVVDVGANHGTFALEAASFVGEAGTVYAFEPTPKTRAQLERHLRLNGLGNVKISPFAVGESAGTAMLRIHESATGLNSLAPEAILWEGQTVVADEILEVPIVTLDSHAEAEDIERVDLLKIDVEGFELGVIRGARRLLASRRVSWILLEISDEASRNARVSPADLLTELEHLGYRVCQIEPDGKPGKQVNASCSFPGGVNYVASP